MLSKTLSSGIIISTLRGKIGKWNRSIKKIHFDLCSAELLCSASLKIPCWIFSSHSKAKYSAAEPRGGQSPSWLLTSLKHIKSSGSRRSIHSESVDTCPLGCACICITLWWPTCASVKVHRLRLGWINLCSVNHNKTQMSNCRLSVLADLAFIIS